MDATLELSEKTNFIELKKMTEVFDLIQNTPRSKPGRRILAYDLDNTILTPLQLAGSDHWFKEHVNREHHSSGDLNLAKQNSLNIFKNIQKKTDVKLVESETAKIICALQSKEYREQDYIVIGLTAREKVVADYSIQQLLSLGIDFNQGIFKDIAEPCVSNPENGIFKNGIMFAAFSNKGLALKGLIENHQLDISDVFFIDDSLRNVQDVIANTGVDCTGIYYTHLEAQALHVDLTVSDIQIKYLDKILPDPVAKAVHEHHESELSNTHLKLEFKEKNSAYKPYAYFWANHQKDLNHIQEYFNSEQCEPKIKQGFYSFKPDHPILACRVKVPLESTAPLVGFLFQNQVLKERDFRQAASELAYVQDAMVISKPKM